EALDSGAGALPRRVPAELCDEFGRASGKPRHHSARQHDRRILPRRATRGQRRPAFRAAALAQRVAGAAFRANAFKPGSFHRTRIIVAHYPAVIPPSTGTAAPVTKLESSLARNRTTWAISSAVAIRFSGCLALQTRAAAAMSP